MTNRLIVLSILCFVCYQDVMAQNKNISGKAIYEIASQTNQRSLEMWFTDQEYMYKYRLTTDAHDLPAFKDKKYKNIQDSLDDDDKIQKWNAHMKSIPIQYWYGKLGSDVVIYSNFDNTLKTYCIRDTVLFVKWELIQDTMTVHGMVCQKASGIFGDVTYTAWFAPSIPVSVAPLQFRGLPGLLIKVTNNVTGITVSLTDLEWPAKTPVAVLPCSGSPFISKSEMQEIRNVQNASQRKILEASQKEFEKKHHQ